MNSSIKPIKISDIVIADKPGISFEVFPPKRLPNRDAATEAAEMQKTKDTVGAIAETRPSFISVTYGAAGGTTGANTCELASFVQDTCNTTALAHLTCLMANREGLAEEVKKLRAKGIANILCLRGDAPANADVDAIKRNSGFPHAINLIKALRPSGFCLGGACYPEGHPECAHLDEDIAHLKEKVDAGLDFLTTQMFFDNNIYFRYLARLRTSGITIPVLPGIMPVTSGKQITRICNLSGTHLPPRFRAIVDRFGDDPLAMMDAGIAYATEQIIDLFADGVNHVHVYTMNKPEIARRITSNLAGII